MKNEDRLSMWQKEILKEDYHWCQQQGDYNRSQAILKKLIDDIEYTKFKIKVRKFESILYL